MEGYTQTTKTKGGSNNKETVSEPIGARAKRPRSLILLWSSQEIQVFAKRCLNQISGNVDKSLEDKSTEVEQIGH